MKEFGSGAIFSYNRRHNLYRGIIVLICFASLLFGIFLYFLFLKDSFSFLGSAFSHFLDEIRGFTYLGAVYASSFGNLFFVMVSMEAVYIAFLKAGKEVLLLYPLYMLGYLFAFTLNYEMGSRFSYGIKKIIGLRKFYWFKGLLNRHGSIIVFVFNILPLPAPPLSALLGVFRYNRTRFYVLFFAGQCIKYAVISYVFGVFL